MMGKQVCVAAEEWPIRRSAAVHQYDPAPTRGHQAALDVRQLAPPDSGSPPTDQLQTGRCRRVARRSPPKQLQGCSAGQGAAALLVGFFTSWQNFLQTGRISLLIVAVNIMTCFWCGVARKISWTSLRMSAEPRAKRRRGKEGRSGQRNAMRGRAISSELAFHSLSMAWTQQLSAGAPRGATGGDARSHRGPRAYGRTRRARNA